MNRFGDAAVHWWKRWFKGKPERRESQFVVTAAALRAIEPSRMRNVFSSDMSIFQLTVCKPNVEEYISLLKMVISAIEEDRMLYAAQLGIDPQRVYIRDFFVSKSKLMLNPVEKFAELADLAVKFLTLYEEKVNQPEKSFNLEKNLLLTQQLVGNLCVLSKEL